ncbi:hypothetical protein [Pseudomonas putida]|uniref:hypothetical protein n=1 Tax=Pseudomonas putida TaxID=303 RepID=UPI002B2454F6|nr:hypothetical protein [Pseudomonas putida]
MKLAKSISVGTLLLGLVGTVFAEGGHERVINFNENFRAEQARLWNGDSSDQKKQQIAQESQKESTDDKKQADN